MSSPHNSAQGILLEAGTNEMELLVFKLDQCRFGINVAKVREIVQRPKTIFIPHAPAAVEGSFKLRDCVLTLINLGRHFGMEGDNTQNGHGIIIIVEFNRIRCGILVDSVEIIHRLRWDDIKPPSDFLADLKAPITGIAEVNKQIVMVIDFESVIGEILGINSVSEPEDLPQNLQVNPEDIRILLADDSSILRASLKRILTGRGFTNITVCADGEQAWNTIAATKNHPEQFFNLILTDIEMPRMDGLHLTARVKADPDFKNIPVVLFSSLITEDNLRKGESVGADAQVSKPDSKQLIGAIEECLAKNHLQLTDTAAAVVAATTA